MTSVGVHGRNPCEWFGSLVVDGVARVWMLTEGRGIKLTQLEEIVAYIRVCAHCWCEMVRAQVSIRLGDTFTSLCLPRVARIALCWCVNYGACTFEREGD